MANAPKTMLDNSVDWDEFEIEEEEKLEFEDDSEPEDDPDYEDEEAPDNHVRFNDTFVLADKVQSALEYYREPTKGSRSLLVMNRRYRWITTEYHMQRLRKFEREGQIRADRRNNLRVLARKLKEEFDLRMSKGLIVHDTNLREIALNFNRELQIQNFGASHTWIQKFKKANRISSRHITSFVSKRSLRDREFIERNANEFVFNIRQQMDTIPLSAIVNADQSGILKELYTARTLAPTGCRTVECVVKSVSATTHSYTVLPMIFADGRLGTRLYVVLQEPHGQFPLRGHFTASNLVVDCHKSHMMTKQLMMNWLKECVINPDMPDKMLLIVDSWSSFKDHDSIQSLVPHGKTLVIRNIHPGATSKIQPLDVYFFLTFKGFVKRFTGYVSSNELEVKLHQRDNTLKMLSLVYNQFCAPRFQHFLLYSCEFEPGTLIKKDERNNHFTTLHIIYVALFL
uniref:HTH CENPB-type domain-containing protein n=1 Tax=Plectus sambesii TaxID=2011161 RepID=A0A914V4D4_9BILA